MIKKTLALALSALFTFPAFAEFDVSESQAQLSFGWAPVITLSGGPMWSSPGHYSIMYYTNAFGSTLYSQYYPHKETSTQGAAELFFALQREVIPGLGAQLGIQIAGATDAKTRGQVVLNGIPGFYNYSYNINHMRVGAKGKLIALRPILAQPYISGGIAASYNQSHIFYATPLTIFTPYTPWYKKSTIIGFAFSLGIGVQKTFCKNWQVGVGYEFDSLGKSQLGVDNSYPYFTDGRGIHLTNWYAHQLQFSLSYNY